MRSGSRNPREPNKMYAGIRSLYGKPRRVLRTTMFKEKPQVLISGAGPVGLFAALALTRRGVRVQIVDTGVWPCSHSYALGLHSQTVKLLEEAGIAEPIAQTAYPVKSIGLYDSRERRAQIRLAGAGTDAAVSVVRQSTLEELLEKALSAAGVRVFWRHEIVNIEPESDRVIATISKFDQDSRGHGLPHSEWALAKLMNLEVPFLVGADGHNSYARQALNATFSEIAPAQYHAVFEFKTDANLDHEMRIVLGEHTTDILWPLPDGFCRWSFQLTHYSDASAAEMKDRLLSGGFRHVPAKRPKDRMPASIEWGNLPVLKEEALRKFIATRAPWFTGSIDSFTWRTVVQFERRLASTFGRGRIGLAGDAAHLTVPAGVQSMNGGLAEANDLAAVFADGSAMDGALNRYSERWTNVWRQLHGLERSVRATSHTDPWIKKHADRLISCLPAYGSGLAPLAIQLGLEIPSTVERTAAP